MKDSPRPKRRLALYKVDCVRCGAEIFRDLSCWEEDQECDGCLDHDRETLRGGVANLHRSDVIVTPLEAPTSRGAREEKP